jgi:serine/threonine protein kinase
LGPYRILEKVGEGGMGVVYRAEDTRQGRRVALKVLRFTLEETPELIEQFHRAGWLTASLDHPNVCPVYEVGQIEGTHFLSMRFIEGTPLSRLREDKPWPTIQALGLISQLARALGEIHDKGVLHLDLKPGNVILQGDGEPILVDFGLGQPYPGSGHTPEPSGYLAPEQVGAIWPVGPATDIYALAAILYHLLTGEVPFKGGAKKKVRQILYANPRPPSALRPGLDSYVDALCLQALAKNPQTRFSSMPEFLGIVQALLRQAGGRRSILSYEAVPIPDPPAEPAPDSATISVPESPGRARVICPGCGRRLRIPPAMEGKALKCPRCQQSLGIYPAPRVASPQTTSLDTTNEEPAPLLVEVLPITEGAPVPVPLTAWELLLAGWVVGAILALGFWGGLTLFLLWLF